MIYCPNCGIANRDGSRFCNECGTKLPTGANIKCPMCSTMNPPGNVFCDNCHARLVPVIAPEPSEQSMPANRDVSLPEKSEAAPPAAASADSVPDWMRDTSSEEQPDWLQRLAENSQLAAGAQSAGAAPTAAASSGAATPDWLSNLSADLPSEPSAAPASKDNLPEPGEVPDWLSNLRATAPSADETRPIPVQPNETSDQLDKFGKAESTPPPTEPSTSEPLDWLNNLRAAAPSATHESVPAPSGSDEMPDWLSQITGGAMAAASASPSNEMPAEEAAPSDVPDWLRQLDTSSALANEPTAASADREKPDWLKDEEPPAVLGEEQPQPSEMPDWLKEFQSASESIAPTPAASASIEEPSVSAPAAEIPDWLSALQPSQLAEEPAKPIEKAVEPTIKIERPAPPIEKAVEPTVKIEQPAVIAKPTVAAAQPTSPADMPDWLRGVGQQLTPRDQSVPILPELPPELREEPAAAAELPEWLQALRKGAPASGVPAGVGLVQTEIPAWVEALKPHEDAGEPSAEEASDAEQEGVLAGIAHTLPVIPLVAEVQGVAAKLKVETSAQDFARAAMFQELLARGASAPKQVTAVLSRGAKLRRRALPWVITLALLLIALFTWSQSLNDLIGFKVLPSVDKLPSKLTLQLTFDQIDQLADGSHVLMVFDYDPIQAGEMNPIAIALLRQLRAKNVEVDLASLNPLGPSMAQSIWHQLDASGGAATSQNLGYVAGQSIGAQQLLVNNGPIDLVIELASSPDSLRWWVEQIAATNSNVPLIAGLSAGAEPLALPYIRSGQVKGTLVGLADALQYAHQANGASGLSDQDSLKDQIHLDTQTLGNWLMVPIILIGMLSALFARGGRRSTR